MFNLNQASKVIRKIAAANGIKTGYVELYPAGIPVEDLGDERLVAVVTNKRRRLEITAGDIKHALKYLL